MSTAAEIGSRIQLCRSRLRFSQQEMADLIGIAAAQFYRYEAGRTKPRPVMADRIADAFGVSTSWLLTGEGDMERPEKEELGLREHPDFHLLKVEFPIAEARRLRKYAKARGMTAGQVLKALALQHLDKLKADDATAQDDE